MQGDVVGGAQQNMGFVQIFFAFKLIAGCRGLHVMVAFVFAITDPQESHRYEHFCAPRICC
jgi:hypothetical protein